MYLIGGVPLNEVDLQRAIALLTAIEEYQSSNEDIKGRIRIDVQNGVVSIQADLLGLSQEIVTEILNGDFSGYSCIFTGQDATEEANDAVEEMSDIFQFS